MNRVTLQYFTLLLIFTAFIGSRLVQIGFGDYNITPYRLLCAIGLILMPLNRDKMSQEKLIFFYYFFLICWMLYSFVLFVVSTPDKTGFWETFFFLLCGTITTYYIGLYVNDFHMLKRCFFTIEIASILPYIIAIYEIITGNYMFVSDYNADYYSMESAMSSALGVRVPISTYANPNDFSLMILSVLVTSSILYKISSGKQSILHLIMIWTSVFLVLAAQSRAAFICLLLYLGIVFVYKFYKLQNSKKILLLSLVPLLLVGLFWLLLVFQDLLDIMLDFEDSSDTTRRNLIRNGFVFLESSYYMGVGLGNIEYYMSHHSVFDAGLVLNIHNWWMEIIVSSGVFIFIWYIILYVRLIRRTINKLRTVQDSALKFVYLFSFAFLVMFVIDSMSSSSVARIECSWVFMALMFIPPNIAYNNQLKQSFN